MKLKHLIFTGLIVCCSLTGCKGRKNSESETDSEIPEESLREFEKLQNLTQYSVNIQDATSLGLKKGSSSSRNLKLDSGDFETTQTLVKTTTDYDALDPTVNDDGTLNVCFNKVDTTVTTKIVDGQKTLIAYNDSRETNEIKVDEYGTDFIRFHSDSKHEYCAVNGSGDAVTSWIKGVDGITTISSLPVNNNPALSDLIVQRKSDSNSEIVQIDFTVMSSNSISFYASEYNSYPYYSYRLIDANNNIYVGWTKFETSGTHYFENINLPERITSKNFGILARTINAVVSYPAYPNFTYSLVDKNGTAIVSNISSSSPKNISEDSSYIKIGGLVEGEKYVLKYHGVGEETTVTQSKVGGEIDKLYVYNDQFSFVSFVPYGTSSRPADSDLKRDKDGIALYDKKDYFSSNERLSFVFDNFSGYIYLIQNIHISLIHNNLLLSDANDFIYDFKIDGSNNLVIYSLFSNPEVKYFDFFKDKYGTNVIKNNKLNLYDENTNTYYFCEQAHQDDYTFIVTRGEFDSFDKLQNTLNAVVSNYDEWQRLYNFYTEILEIYTAVDSNKILNTHYFLTSENTILCVNYCNKDFLIPSEDAYIVLPNNEQRELTVTDNFYTITNAASHYQTQFLKIKDGIVQSYTGSSDSFERNVRMYFYDFINDEYICFDYDYYDDKLYSFNYIKQFDVCLYFDVSEQTVYSHTIKDIRNRFIYQWVGFNSFSCPKSYVFAPEQCAKVLENTDIDDSHKEFLKYGVNGNTYYEIVVEEVNGEVRVNSYVSGTYVAPEIKIILQPINR